MYRRGRPGATKRLTLSPLRQECHGASDHRFELRSVSARHAVLPPAVPVDVERRHRSDARARCNLVELVRADVHFDEARARVPE